MPTINSRLTSRIDRLLGYLGLFLIGLIGWVCDRLPAHSAPGSRQRNAEHAGLLRK